VTTILAGTVDPDRLRGTCEQQAGLTLGVGLGPFEGRAFRIGHMGHLNPPMVLGTLGTIEAALLAAGAPIGGSGVAAAAATAGRAFATAGG
jgi:alanine-glyoxylate transaminase/serine-glyoxylate transaminase/serine-pyruvate transaminase